MAEDSHAFVLNDYAKQLIQFKAHQLARYPGFSRSDVEDLQQDLMMHLIKQAGKHDPTIASIETYVATIVDSAVAMILRYRGQKKRAGASTLQSLDIEVGHDDGHPTTVGQAVTDADHARRLRRLPENEQDGTDRRLDIQGVLAALPLHLRDVCIHLMEKPEATVAKEKGVSRHWMREATERIRKHFEDAGLGNS